MKFCYSLFISSTLLIMSCEGFVCTDGIILDKVSTLPIDSVLCVVLENKYDSVYSDSKGKYSEICSEFRGCAFGCGDIHVQYSKTGYDTLVKLNPGQKTTILLKKK